MGIIFHLADEKTETQKEKLCLLTLSPPPGSWGLDLNPDPTNPKPVKPQIPISNGSADLGAYQVYQRSWSGPHHEDCDRVSLGWGPGQPCWNF